jgi:hypothetical protein
MNARRLLGAIALLVITTSGWAADANIGDSSASFARLKSLSGEWAGKMPDGSKSTLRYEVISGGSAVVEHFENDAMGAANAMVTVYYLDGDRLVLTHYCMAKNQPHMQAESFDNATGELRFVFAGATGLANAESGHMHNATLRFVDANHIAEDWQYFEGGKAKFNEAALYARVK